MGAIGAWLGEFGELVSADRQMLTLTLNREHHLGAVCVNLDEPFADGSFDAIVCLTMLYHRGVLAPSGARWLGSFPMRASSASLGRGAPTVAGRRSPDPCGSTLRRARPRRPPRERRLIVARS
jgi:hypothetical protein